MPSRSTPAGLPTITKKDPSSHNRRVVFAEGMLAAAMIATSTMKLQTCCSEGGATGAATILRYVQYAPLNILLDYINGRTYHSTRGVRPQHRQSVCRHASLRGYSRYASAQTKQKPFWRMNTNTTSVVSYVVLLYHTSYLYYHTDCRG